MMHRVHDMDKHSLKPPTTSILIILIVSHKHQHHPHPHIINIILTLLILLIIIPLPVLPLGVAESRKLGALEAAIVFAHRTVAQHHIQEVTCAL